MSQAAHTRKAQFKCLDIVVEDKSDDLKNKVKEKIPDDPTKAMGLHNVVSIAVGVKYDLTTNVNVTDGITNDAECVIDRIGYRVKDSTRPSIIRVSFPEANIGQNHRNEFALLLTKNGDRTWTPIFEITRQFKIQSDINARYFVDNILYGQLELRAKTIHRCQGGTLTEAVLDLLPSTRENMHYVALSRVKSSSTLHIINLNEKKICVSQKVQGEMSRLREQCLLPSTPFLHNQSSRMKLLFHDVRSLHLHFKDVAYDYNVQAAEVNIFFETRLYLSDCNTTYEMANFKLFRNDFKPNSNGRSSYGMAMYIKSNIDCATTPFTSNFNNLELSVCVLNDPFPNLHIVDIYR